MAGKFLSLEEAARRLGVSIEEVNRLVDRKELFPMRDGATIKFKVDEIERVAASLGVGAADDDELALELELSSPGLGGSLLGAGSAVAGGELSLGEPLDEESIFAGDADGGAVAASQTVVRGGGDPVLGSGTFDVDDLAIESIVGASSPSLGGPAAPAASDSGTLAIDLSNIGGGSLAGGSLAGGSLAGLSAASGLGGSLASAVDSGLSLEGGGLDISGIDLDNNGRVGAAPGSAVESLGGSLAGEAFELGADVTDEESASVVIPTEETGDSSFFGAAMDDAASVSFGDASGSVAIPVGAAGDFEIPSLAPPFSVWQVVGLICCTLLMFVCALVVFDVLTTVRGPQGSPISSPLLSALADTFGW
jgi:excisionase family DNA binding protein